MIFISYSWENHQRASEIVDMLCHAGITVYFDRRAEYGEGDWSRGLATNVANCTALCLLWSAEAETSRWVRHELLTARALGKRIFPVCLDETFLKDPFSNLDRFEPRDLPAELKTKASTPFVYDFSSADEKKTSEYPHSELFGRSQDLVNLYLEFVGNLHQIGTRQLGVHAGAGWGKTQLIAEFVRRFYFEFTEGVHWIDASNPAGWRDALLALADKLNLSQGSNAHRMWLLRERLHTLGPNGGSSLLVLDNVRDPADLRRAKELNLEIPVTAIAGNLLFTTQRHFRLPGLQSYELKLLSADDALRLLTAKCSPHTPEERAAAQEICDMFGRFPLALAKAARRIGGVNRLSFARFRDRMRRDGLQAIDLFKVSETELVTQHRTVIGATLDEQLEGLDEVALEVFRFASHQEGLIPESRLALMVADRTSAQPMEGGIAAVDRLRQRHILEPSESEAKVTLHSLYGELGRGSATHTAKAKAKAKWAARLADSYLSPALLSEQLASRGIEGVAEDLRLAKDWGAKSKRLAELLSVVDRERHHFRCEPAPNPLLQLYSRAVRAGFLQLAKLILPNIPNGLCLSWTSWRDDPALVCRLPGVPGEPSLTAVALSGDGRKAVSGTGSGSLCVWDLDSRSLLRVFRPADKGGVAPALL